MYLLPRKKHQEGNVLVIVILVVLVIAVALSLYFGINSSQKASTSTTYQATSSGEKATSNIYKNQTIHLQVEYPVGYLYEDVTTAAKALDPILAVNFYPEEQGERETNSVFLTALPKGNANDAYSWIMKNTTPKSKSSGTNNQYRYYNVSDVKQTTVGIRPIVTFTQTFSDGTKTEATALPAPDYILVLGHTQGYADAIYNQMLSSLSY